MKKLSRKKQAAFLNEMKSVVPSAFPANLNGKNLRQLNFKEASSREGFLNFLLLSTTKHKVETLHSNLACLKLGRNISAVSVPYVGITNNIFIVTYRIS